MIGRLNHQGWVRTVAVCLDLLDDLLGLALLPHVGRRAVPLVQIQTRCKPEQEEHDNERTG